MVDEDGWFVDVRVMARRRPPDLEAGTPPSWQPPAQPWHAIASLPFASSADSSELLYRRPWAPWSSRGSPRSSDGGAMDPCGEQQGVAVATRRAATGRREKGDRGNEAHRERSMAAAAKQYRRPRGPAHGTKPRGRPPISAPAPAPIAYSRR